MRKFLMLALLALPVFSANAEETVHIGLNTSEGYIELALDKEKAPISVENFVTYVEEGHYDGTIFHRVIKNFMIQGGGFDASMNRKPTRAAIKNEAKNGLKNKRGSVAMARTASVDSATCSCSSRVRCLWRYSITFLPSAITKNPAQWPG